MLLRDVLAVADSVDAGGRRVDKTPHATLLGNRNEGGERIVVDRFAERRIQLEAGIVGDARQVDDGVAPREDPPEQRLIADVPFNFLERAVILLRGQYAVSE